MTQEIEMLPVPESATDLFEFCEQFLHEIAGSLGITYEQLVADQRAVLISEGLIET